MRFRSFKLSIVGLLLLMSISSSANSGAKFHACYALKNGNMDGHQSQIQLNRICLSDHGDISLYGPRGFRYDFSVDATFHPSQYRCHVDRKTGDQYCGYSRPFVNFSGHDDHAWIEADVDTQPVDWANHGALFITLDLDRYMFWDHQPLPASDQEAH